MIDGTCAFCLGLGLVEVVEVVVVEVEVEVVVLAVVISEMTFSFSLLTGPSNLSCLCLMLVRFRQQTASSEPSLQSLLPSQTRSLEREERNLTPVPHLPSVTRRSLP